MKRKPTYKMVLKQRKRLGITEGMVPPCLEKYWRKKKLAWLQQGYKKVTCSQYARKMVSTHIIRGADYYCDEVYVCKRKRGK